MDANPLVDRLVWPCEDAARNPVLNEFASLCRDRLWRDGAYYRSGFDPIEFKSYLSHVILSERLAPRRFFYRVVGSDIVARCGIELSQQPLDRHTMGLSENPFVEMLETTLKGGKPVFLSGTLFWVEREYVPFRQVTVPLVDDEKNPRFGLTLVRF